MFRKELVWKGKSDMLNCKDTTKLVSEGLDRKLSFKELLGLKAHLAMCSACRNFKQQMNTMRQAMNFYASSDLKLPKNKAKK